MITRYGMSRGLRHGGPGNRDQPVSGRRHLPGLLRGDPAARSTSKVVALVKAGARQRPPHILQDNRPKLDELAKYLYEKETITGEEFMNILNREDESAAPAEEKIKE